LHRPQTIFDPSFFRYTTVNRLINFAYFVGLRDFTLKPLLNKKWKLEVLLFQIPLDYYYSNLACLDGNKDDEVMGRKDILVVSQSFLRPDQTTVVAADNIPTP